LPRVQCSGFRLGATLDRRTPALLTGPALVYVSGPMTSLLLVAAAAAVPNATQLEKMTARFAPTELTVDLSTMPDGEKAALARLVEAARTMDGIFLRQAWAGNPDLLVTLAAEATPLGRARLHAFLVNKGPWSRLDRDRPFLPGVPAKPPEANFYPPGSTKEQLEQWLKSLPPDQRTDASGFFSVIRRGTDGKLASVPYAVEYQGELARAASLLREAARLTAQPTLKAFLNARADAFLSNDYYDSDVLWMQLDSSIEPTIGPYEVYNDEWFNAKAAFEAFISVRDEAETRKLASLSERLQGIEDRLPIEPRLRNPKLGALAPIRVVNEIFCSGDANHGVQTAAYNLPNDERVVREKGTKRIMLKNVQEAKFEKTLLPIARVALAPKDQRNVSFDAFFTAILMHELMHGLGPHRVAGGEETVRQALQEVGSALEEAKADISGLFALQLLVDDGALPKELQRTMYTTFLASAFRTLRFGVNDAHGRGMALQVNTLLDAGAFRVSDQGTFSVDASRVKEAVSQLTHDIMTLQSSGDVAKARAWLEKMGTVRPEVQRVLDRLSDVPVDIEPKFTTAAQLAGF
jgi:hypothetical protein